MTTLSAHAFELLLARLDADPTRAADEYELVRLKLIKCLEWKGCPESQAEALADIAIDRIAKKLGEGEKVGNIFAYANGVMRFVWLEHCHKHREDAAGDDLPETPVQPAVAVLEDPDLRMKCLRKCLVEVAPDEADRKLILGYYDTEFGEKTKEMRKKLADELGISLNALRVRAWRLRARLEACINKSVVIKSSVRDTYQQEVM